MLREFAHVFLPRMEASALDQWFRQVIEHKALTREALDKFRSYWQVLRINQYVVGEIEFLEERNAATKFGPKQEPIIRLTLNNVPNTKKLRTDGKLGEQ